MITEVEVERAQAAVQDAERRADTAKSGAEHVQWSTAAEVARFELRRVEALARAQAEQTRARAQAEREIDESGALAAMANDLTAHDDAVTAFAVAAQQVLCDLADALRARDDAIARISSAELAPRGLKLRNEADDATGYGSSGVRLGGRWHLRVHSFGVLRALLGRVEWARLGSQPPFGVDWRVVRLLERVPQPERVELPRPPRARIAQVRGAPAYVRNLAGRVVEASTLTEAERAEMERRDPKIKVSTMAPQAWDQMRREMRQPDEAPDSDRARRGRA